MKKLLLICMAIALISCANGDAMVRILEDGIEQANRAKSQQELSDITVDVRARGTVPNDVYIDYLRISQSVKLTSDIDDEALAGEKHTGFDEPTVTDVAKQVKQIVDSGVQVGIVIGGGNFWRGRSSENIDRTKADQIGMLATIMNCIYVSEIFRSVGMKTNILTPFECGSFTKLFSKDRANKYFEKGMVVFFAGGTGHPYFSTDTGVVLRAIEVDAEVILLAKSIDAVYDADPAKNPDAKRYDEVTIHEVIEKNLQVVDMTASILARDNKMPMWVFGLNEENSIVNTVKGNFNGTKVTV